MVIQDNLGRKLCEILQSQSFGGNNLEFKYNFSESCNRANVSTLAEIHTNRGVNILYNYNALNRVRYSVQRCCASAL
jgi:hypothetical protein